MQSYTQILSNMYLSKALAHYENNFDLSLTRITSLLRSFGFSSKFEHMVFRLPGQNFENWKAEISLLILKTSLWRKFTLRTYYLINHLPLRLHHNMTVKCSHITEQMIYVHTFRRTRCEKRIKKLNDFITVQFSQIYTKWNTNGRKYTNKTNTLYASL